MLEDQGLPSQSHSVEYADVIRSEALLNNNTSFPQILFWNAVDNFWSASKTFEVLQM